MFKTTVQTATWVATLPLALWLGACATEATDSDTVDENPINSGSGGTTGEGSGGATAASGGSDTGSGTGGSVDDAPIEPLPAAMTDLFGPSGFMGREGTKNETDGIVMSTDGCPERAEGAAGLCYSVVYTPQELDEVSGQSWAGMFFQNPELNWGEKPGVRIEAGATKISFTAWSKTSSQTLQFMAGGIGGVDTEYGDTFKVETEFTVTTTPTTYELNLVGSTYDYVLGGFGWVAQVSSLDPIEFYIDDVQWVK